MSFHKFKGLNGVTFTILMLKYCITLYFCLWPLLVKLVRMKFLCLYWKHFVKKLLT